VDARCSVRVPCLVDGKTNPGLAERKLAGLVRCGVGLVINLMEAHEVNWDGKRFVDYCPKLQELAKAVGRTVCSQRMSIRDADVPTVAEMRTILDSIDAAGTAGQVVYVHCLGGNPLEHVFGRVRGEVGDELVVNCEVRSEDEKVLNAVGEMKVGDECAQP
jgi:hypothetical protein